MKIVRGTVLPNLFGCNGHAACPLSPLDGVHLQPFGSDLKTELLQLRLPHSVRLPQVHLGRQKPKLRPLSTAVVDWPTGMAPIHQHRPATERAHECPPFPASWCIRFPPKFPSPTIYTTTEPSSRQWCTWQNSGMHREVVYNNPSRNAGNSWVYRCQFQMAFVAVERQVQPTRGCSEVLGNRLCRSQDDGSRSSSIIQGELCAPWKGSDRARQELRT